METTQERFNPLVDVLGSFPKSTPVPYLTLAYSEKSSSKEETLPCYEEEALQDTAVTVSRPALFAVLFASLLLIASMGFVAVEKKHLSLPNVPLKMPQFTMSSSSPSFDFSYELQQSKARASRKKAATPGRVLVGFDRAQLKKPELVLASLSCNLPTVQRLLRNGVNINSADVTGDTALIWSVRRGCHSVTKLLIENGANAWQRSHNGFDAVHWSKIANNIYAQNLIYRRQVELGRL